MEASAYLPLMVRLQGRRVLVVGGGRVATHKVALLRQHGGLITVVSPCLSSELQQLVASGAIDYLARRFEVADVAGRLLVVAATDDGAVNRAVVAACRRAGVMVGAVDESWPLGDFITPATIREAGMVVALSSEGESCRRTRWLKERLQGVIQRLLAEEHEG